MTIITTNSRNQYAASVGQTEFLYTFKIFNDEDLEVYKTPVGNIPDPNIDILILNIDYTVTGAGEDSGGDISLTVPTATGDIITVVRNISQTLLPQEDFKVNGKFKAEELNIIHSKLLAIFQDNVNLLLNLGLTYSVTEVLDSGQTTIPKLAENQVWKANAAGNIAAVELTENPDWSTLRSELVSVSPSSPGSDVVGSYNAELGGGQALTSYLTKLYVQSFETLVEKMQQNSYGHLSIEYTTPVNAYSATCSFTPLPTSSFTVVPSQPNTGAATLSINGGSAVPIRNSDDSLLIGGELKFGTVYLFYRGSTAWIIISAKEIATKDLMVAANTDNFIVTPKNIIYHPNVVKKTGSWTQLNVPPYTITAHVSKGISSITTWAGGDPGRIRLAFSPAFINTNYIVNGLAGETTGNPGERLSLSIHEKAANYLDLYTLHTSSDDLKGASIVDVSIIGDVVT